MVGRSFAFLILIPLFLVLNCPCVLAPRIWPVVMLNPKSCLSCSIRSLRRCGCCTLPFFILFAAQLLASADKLYSSAPSSSSSLHASYSAFCILVSFVGLSRRLISVSRLRASCNSFALANGCLAISSYLGIAALASDNCFSTFAIALSNRRGTASKTCIVPKGLCILITPIY